MYRFISLPIKNTNKITTLIQAVQFLIFYLFLYEKQRNCFNNFTRRKLNKIGNNDLHVRTTFNWKQFTIENTNIFIGVFYGWKFSRVT